MSTDTETKDTEKSTWPHLAGLVLAAGAVLGAWWFFFGLGGPPLLDRWLVGGLGTFESLEAEEACLVGEITEWVESADAGAAVGGVTIRPAGCDPLTNKYEASSISLVVTSDVGGYAAVLAIMDWLRVNRDFESVPRFPTELAVVDGQNVGFRAGTGRGLDVNTARIVTSTGCYER